MTPAEKGGKNEAGRVASSKSVSIYKLIDMHTVKLISIDLGTLL